MENFEKTLEPKIVVCLICTSKLAKASINLKTKKNWMLKLKTLFMPILQEIIQTIARCVRRGLGKKVLWNSYYFATNIY